MAAVADHFPVNIPDPECGSHQPWLAVMIRRHAIIHMSHGGGAVGDSQKSFFIRSGGMAHADGHPVRSTVAGQGMAGIVLRCKSNIADQPLCRLLIHLKLFDRGRRNSLRRLGSLIIHIKIGAFKMDSQNLGSLVALLHYLCHTGYRSREDVGHLSHRGRQNGCNALFWDPAHPLS